MGMPREAIATRVPREVAEHVEAVVESPATDYTSKSEVLREIVTDQFE